MDPTSPPRSPGPLATLDAAVAWTHERLLRARAADVASPTPCAGWDLGDLLTHMEDSLAAIAEAALGAVALEGPPPRPSRDPAELVDRVVRRACELRGRWHTLPSRFDDAPVEVDVLALDRDTLALVGALEVTVHGWDVGAAVGEPARPPEHLAARLLAVARQVVPDEERGGRFGPAVAPYDASPAARLLAHLGRTERPGPTGPTGTPGPLGAGLSEHSGRGGNLEP